MATGRELELGGEDLERHALVDRGNDGVRAPDGDLGKAGIDHLQAVDTIAARDQRHIEPGFVEEALGLCVDRAVALDVRHIAEHHGELGLVLRHGRGGDDSGEQRGGREVSKQRQ